MERGVRQRLVLRALSDCLSVLRRFGQRGEAEFDRAALQLPGRLRQMADMLESPPPDLAPHPELPSWDSYTAWAESYDTERDNCVIAGEEAVIWDMIGPPQGLRVLDVGCGTGRHALPLARGGSRVVGIEPTAEMLARALRKVEAEGLEADLRQAVIEDLGPEFGQFDLVLCCLVLSHVRDLRSAIARMAERIRPGGRLIVSDFHPFQLLIGFRTTYQRAGRKDVVPNYIHLPSDYLAAMTSAGLAMTALREPGTLPAFPGLPVTIVIEARKPPQSGAENEPPGAGADARHQAHS